MANIAFKKGLVANLPASHAEGTFYITTDERAIYLDISDSARVRLGGFEEFETTVALQANAHPDESAIYYVSEINCLAKWDGEKYVQLNHDTKDSFYQVVRNSEEDDNAAIQRALGENSAVVGDICVIKTAIAGDDTKLSYMGYVYDGANWAAMDGNVNSANVIMGKDIVLAGSYASIGNVSKGTTIAKGKTLDELFAAFCTQELYPSKPTPTCGVTLSGAGAKEVGVTFTPSYTTSFDKKSYAYADSTNGTNTGVTATAWSVTDSKGVVKTTASGSFDAFVVGDDTSYKLSATASYSDGYVPVSNLGNPYPAAQIKAGTTAAANSGTVSGYRNWYMYVGTDNTSAVDSAWIRSTTAKGSGKNASTQSAITIPAGTKRIMIAIPAGSGYTKQLKDVTDLDGMNLSMIGNFAESSVQVEGANGYASMAYRVYVAENANGMAATRYTFTIG